MSDYAPIQIFGWAATGVTALYAMWRIESEGRVYRVLENFEIDGCHSDLTRTSLQDLKFLHPAARRERDAIIEDLEHYKKEGLNDEEIRAETITTPIFYYP